MYNLYICVAISKSGKSTWCNEIISKLTNTKLVSLDIIKKTNINESSHIKAFDLINHYLTSSNVLFDANNYSYEHRNNLLEHIKTVSNKYAIVFDVSLEQSLDYIKNNKTYLTKDIIKRQYAGYLKDKNKLSGFNVISKRRI